MSLAQIVPDAPGFGWLGRSTITTIHAGAFSCAPLVLTGDSRTATCPLATIGDFPVMNAGMPGIRIHDACNFAPAALQNAGACKWGKPRITVLQIGVNNVWLDQTTTEWSSMAADYAYLVQALLPFTQRLILTTPPPTEKGYVEPDSSVVIRGQAADTISTIIKNYGYANSLPVVDLNGQMRQSDLTLMPGQSCDGVHFSPLGWSVIGSLLTPVVRYYGNH